MGKKTQIKTHFDGGKGQLSKAEWCKMDILPIQIQVIADAQVDLGKK